MRQFNDFEREIIRRIVSYYDRGLIPNLASIIDPQLENKDIYLDYAHHVVEIRADNHLYVIGTLVDEIRVLTLEIVTTVNLLKDLQNNGYLTLFLEAPLPITNERYGRLVRGNPFISANLNDPTVTDLLLDFSLKSIIVGQPLVDFANNGFQTENQIQINNARTQQTEHNRKASRDFRLAIFGLFVTIILSGIEIYHHTEEVDHLKKIVENAQGLKPECNQPNVLHHCKCHHKKIKKYCH